MSFLSIDLQGPCAHAVAMATTSTNNVLGSIHLEPVNFKHPPSHRSLGSGRPWLGVRWVRGNGRFARFYSHGVARARSYSCANRLSPGSGLLHQFFFQNKKTKLNGLIPTSNELHVTPCLCLAGFGLEITEISHQHELRWKVQIPAQT